MMSGGNPPELRKTIDEMKESGVGFIYTNPIRKKIKCTEILFPVDDKWQGAAYIKTTDSIYLYFESRPSLKLILKHI